MAQVTYRRLGKSGLKVSSLSFGSATFHSKLDQSKLNLNYTLKILTNDLRCC
jgi:aryl-alcohol dehydrogenase-like predicted oxidoreductase